MHDAFPNFAALKAAHDELLKGRRSDLGKDKAAFGAAIRAFVESAILAGTYLENPDERRSAQEILEFWCLERVNTETVDQDTLIAPTLAEYQPQAASGSANPQGEPASTGRTVIRFIALARQWRLSGELEGYLLKDTALQEAKSLSTVDPDVVALIKASEDEEKRALTQRENARTRLIYGLIVGCVLLSSLAATSVYQWDQANKEKVVAEEAAAEATAQTIDAIAAKTQSEALLSAANEDAKVLYDLLDALTKKQDELNALTDFVRGQIDAGNIAFADLPPATATAIAPPSVKRVHISGRDNAISAYDPAFLGRDISLPTLSAAQLPDADKQGAPIKYMNYSLALNTARRIAFYTAANMDRRQRIVLPQLQPGFLRDPRITTEFQPDSTWFARGNLAPGYLVSGPEIAWGPQIAANAVTAVDRLANAVYALPNIAPQFTSFNQGIWSEINRFVLLDHNPNASRVTIFTGPVLSPDDPVIDGVQMPRWFWKVAVSAAFSKDQSDPASDLVVDAFLVPQFREGTNEEAAAPDGKIDIQNYRVGISRIEGLTGLQFDPAIKATEFAGSPLVMAEIETPGMKLAQDVGQLDGPTANIRKAMAQKIVDVLRDQTLDEDDQRLLVTALLAMANDIELLKLTPIGRLNLLFVLSEVPPASWQRAGWRGLAVTASRAVADLEDRAATGRTEIGTDTRDLLNRLKSNLKSDQTPAQTVYFQFAGMTRGKAVTISTTLQQLGWSIPGEERTVNAEGVNEVRFNPKIPDDETAAETMVADLNAALQSNLIKKTSYSKIQPGKIEVWISE